MIPEEAVGGSRVVGEGVRRNLCIPVLALCNLILLLYESVSHL